MTSSDQNVTVTARFDDLPTLQCQPGPTDAELEAMRVAQHAIDVERFLESNLWAQPGFTEATKLATAACETLIAELSAQRDRTVDHDVQSVAIGQVLGARAALERICSALNGDRWQLMANTVNTWGAA